jgi:hypothetical protein
VRYTLKANSKPNTEKGGVKHVHGFKSSVLIFTLLEFPLDEIKETKCKGNKQKD